MGDYLSIFLGFSTLHFVREAAQVSLSITRSEPAGLAITKAFTETRRVADRMM
jgi:hypothetical protein